MPISAKNVLDFARGFYDSCDKTDETERRVGISRLYFGVFLLARDEASKSFPRSGVHLLVQNHYKNQIDSNLKSVGNRLGEFTVLRNKADYDLDQSVAERELNKAKNIAEKIAQVLE